MTLPGTEEDIYHVGAVVEFGDGSKSIKSGMIGPVKGGSVVKFFVRTEDSKLMTTVLAGTHSSSASFETSPANLGFRFLNILPILVKLFLYLTSIL